MRNDEKFLDFFSDARIDIINTSSRKISSRADLRSCSFQQIHANQTRFGIHPASSRIPFIIPRDFEEFRFCVA